MTFRLWISCLSAASAVFLRPAISQPQSHSHGTAGVTPGVSALRWSSSDAPIGYATLNGGTTGGLGGAVTTVTSLAQLQAFAAACEDNTTPKILVIAGTISATASSTVTIKHGANVSILGADGGGELHNVGLVIWDYRNVIVRNLTIHEVLYPNDALTINECENVWIDHNELYSRIGPGITVDTYDGLLDIKEGSRYVTVSWNYLHDHMKCSLIGHTDNPAQRAVDTLFRITYHHNWFARTDGRNPSIRFGAIHMFNNYFEDITDYGIAARNGAHARIENSHYRNVVLPMSTDKFPVTGFPNGYICESGNWFTGTSGANVISQTGCEFWDSLSLPYPYSLDPVEAVAATVTSLAGTFTATSVTDVGSTPTGPRLVQIYPNPFNSSTRVVYQLPERTAVRISIYDAAGRLVRGLLDQEEGPGTSSAVFDAGRLASGVYYVQMKTSKHREIMRCVLLR